MNMMKYFLLLICIFSANAAEENPIVKCTRTDGSVVYTNTGCESGKAEEVLSKPITIIEYESPLSKESSAAFVTWILAIYLLMSALGFVVYGWDKRKAIHNERRIPEVWLHGLEFLGGWPGTLVAQRVMQHKKQKVSYRLVFWLIVMLHLLLWVNYVSGHLSWNAVSGKQPINLEQRLLEKVMEASGLTPVPGEYLEKELNEMLRTLEERQEDDDE